MSPEPEGDRGLSPDGHSQAKVGGEATVQLQGCRRRSINAGQGPRGLLAPPALTLCVRAPSG